MQELVAMRLILIEITNQLYTIIDASLFLSAHIQPPSAIFFIGYKISEKNFIGIAIVQNGIDNLVYMKDFFCQ